MKKIILLITIIFLTFFLINKSLATELYEKQNLLIESLDTEINILENGDLVNTEKIIFLTKPTLPFSWPIFASNVSEIKIKTGSYELTQKDFSISKSSDKTLLIIKNNPSNNLFWQINYKVKNKIKYYKDYDELHWIVIFGNGAIIEEANINVNLLSESSKDCQQKIYAYAVQKTKYKKNNNRTLFYKAYGVEPQGNFTIITKLPKELIKPSFKGKILSKLSNLDFLAGILIAFLITIITWFILKILSLRQKKEITPKNNEILNKPPNTIPASLIGVLINKKLDTREFAATIIELARLGFLTIVKEKEKLYLIKRKPFDEAKPAEKAIIDEIFNPNNSQPKISINLNELKSSEKEKLSSVKISKSSEHIYKIISALDYFTNNPHQVYLRYMKISIGLFFISLLVVFLTIPFIYSYPILFFIPIGLIFSSFIIPQRASLLSLYTKRGKEVAKEWLKFKNYLIQEKNSKENLEEFFQFLPYAIVMKVEKKWASQFILSGFRIPNWLDTGYLSYDISDFVNQFLPLVYDLACTLIETRTPTSR